jgi:uncharacterized protein YukE
MFTKEVKQLHKENQQMKKLIQESKKEKKRLAQFWKVCSLINLV